MRHKGSKCEFTDERNADLLRAYREQVEARDSISITEIAKAISQSPSKRFWVSVGRAYQVITDLDRNISIDNMNPTRKEMFQEIYRRYKIYKEENPSLTRMEILWHVCNQPAPKFYLTPKSIIVILNKVRREDAKKRCYELRKKRLRFLYGTL